jgi:hypothetical protein
MCITWEAPNQVPADHAALVRNDRIKEIDAIANEIGTQVWERHQMDFDKTS